MALPKCSIAPDASGYSYTPGTEVMAIKLDGGASRYERFITGATGRLSVQWTVKEKGYKYLRSLYIITESGSLPFLIDLIIDEVEQTEHTVHFIPDTFRLTTKSGAAFIVTAELEVEPITPDVDDAQDFFDLYNELGDDWSSLDELDTLINTTLPGDMPSP